MSRPSSKEDAAEEARGLASQSVLLALPLMGQYRIWIYTAREAVG